MTRLATPAKGAAFFFEGFEYEFSEEPKPGHLVFVRPEGADTRYSRVTISADELARSTGAVLAEAVQAERDDWVRRIPAAPTPKAGAGPEAQKAAADFSPKFRAAYKEAVTMHHTAATGKLKASPSRQFYHIAADPEDGDGHRPLRLMAPPVEHLSLKLPKALAPEEPTAPATRAAPGTLSITHSPAKGA